MAVSAVDITCRDLSPRVYLYSCLALDDSSKGYRLIAGCAEMARGRRDVNWTDPVLTGPYSHLFPALVLEVNRWRNLCGFFVTIRYYTIWVCDTVHVSAVADEPARRAASRPSCQTKVNAPGDKLAAVVDRTTLRTFAMIDVSWRKSRNSAKAPSTPATMSKQRST